MLLGVSRVRYRHVCDPECVEVKRGTLEAHLGVSNLHELHIPGGFHGILSR